MVLVVYIVANAEELMLVVVRASKEDSSNTDDVIGWELGYIWWFTL